MNINDSQNIEFQNSINDISQYLEKTLISPGGPPPESSQTDLIHQIFSRLHHLHNEIQMRTEYDPGINPGEVNPIILKNLNNLCERLKTISPSGELFNLSNTITDKIRVKIDPEKIQEEEFDAQVKSQANENNEEVESWRSKEGSEDASKAFSPSSLFSSRYGDEPSWSDYSPSPTSDDTPSSPSPSSSDTPFDEISEKERDLDVP